MNTKNYYIGALLIFMSFTCTSAEPSKTGKVFYNVKNFGAVGDGSTLDKSAIQKAINSCYKNGGGTVYFPPGIYLSGSLVLKSNLTIFLDNGATILASQENSVFDPREELPFKNDADEETSSFHYSLIWGEGVENIAIVGFGTLDSNRKDRSGPKTIALKKCAHVTIRDLTIKNAGNYAISMLGTDNVNIDGVTILASYCDGIDPDCCHDVRISNCYIESWDDSICPKSSFSLGYRRSTERLTITNCIIASSSNCFKFGTESGGDFKHVTISNCVMTTYKSTVEYRQPTDPISGITLISADGSNISDITISNISMQDVRYPIFLRIRNRGRDMEKPIPGSLKNVFISNIIASNALIGGIIAGYPAEKIENIHLDNINISLKGSGEKDETKMIVSEMEGKYPSAYRFKDVPAFGIYCRHAKDVHIKDIHLSTQKPDYRHVMVFDDVLDLHLERPQFPILSNSALPLFFDNVQNVIISGVYSPNNLESILQISGESSKNVKLLKNIWESPTE